VGNCGRAEHATGDNMAERRNGAVCKGKNTDTRSWYLILIIVKSRTKYFGALKQCRGNTLFNFNGNTCIVDNYIYSNNEKKGGTYCRVSMAATVTRTPHRNVVSKLSVFIFVGSPALHCI
jgi:hypothetical protein